MKKKSVAKETSTCINNVKINTTCMNRKDSKAVHVDFYGWSDINPTLFIFKEKELRRYLNLYIKNMNNYNNFYILNFIYPQQLTKAVLTNRKSLTYFSIDITLYHNTSNTYEYFINDDALDGFKIDIVNWMETEMGNIYKNKK